MRGVVDRFGQIEPVVLFCVDGYSYGGKRIALADRLTEIVAALPSIRLVVIASFIGEAEDATEKVPRSVTLQSALQPFADKPVKHRRIGIWPTP